MKNIKKSFAYALKIIWAAMPLIIIAAIVVYDAGYHYTIVGN